VSADDRPIVGIAGAGYAVPRFWGIERVHGMRTTYVDAVSAAGGRPVILPPGHAVDLLDAIDAVVLAGGDDIGVDPDRDQAEVALVKGCCERGIPLLGVCRGLQLLTVADGGTLIPDLGPHLPHVRPHIGHPVASAPGSLVAGLLGDRPGVSSVHHQAIDRLGPGWRATAVAEDGVVEAAEWVGPWPALGVQWHPEMDQTGPALFGWLVDTARSAATVRRERYVESGTGI
jgi:putative glutamine amidotransferase